MSESCSPKGSKDTKHDQVHQASTALVYPDKSFTIMNPNSSAKYSKDSVIDLEFKVCHKRHTIQLPTVLQKPLIRLLKSFSRNSSQKVNVTGMTN